MSRARKTRASLLDEEAALPEVVATEAPVASPGTKKQKRNIDISAYEQERLDNIARNEQFLASLGLNSIKSSLNATVAVKAPPKRKTVATKKVAEVQPVRRSGRMTIEKLHEEIATLEKSGESEALTAKRKELEDMVAKKQEGSYQVEASTAYGERESWRRLGEDPVGFQTMTYQEDKYDSAKANKDVCELADLLRCVSTAPPKPQREDFIEYTAMLSNLSIHDNEVAKLTEDRITTVCVHPIADKIVILAGDKSGHLGVWDVRKTESCELHGVYKYQPHVSNIAQIHASPLDHTAIYSTSYDGTIRHFDIVKEQFVQAFEAPEDLNGFYFTDASFLYDEPRCMYVSTSDGCAALIDLRASSKEYAWKRECASGYKLNSVQQHPTMPHLITTSERSTISLYDVRKGSKGSSVAMKSYHSLLGHTLSINSALVSPDGHYVVSVCQDSTVRTWRNFADPSVDADCVVTRHDNNTGRWLSTLRPMFDPKQDHVFALGCLLQPRRIEIFAPGPLGNNASSANTGTPAKKGKKDKFAEDAGGYGLNLVCNLSDDLLGSVCSRNGFHPTLNVVAGGNSSGRVHVFRE